MTQILCIHIGDENDTNVSWGDNLDDDRYHMHIRVVSRRIA